MSKKCQNCNAEMEENMNFCPECRTKWVSSTSNSTSQNVYTEPNEVAQIASNLTFWQKVSQPRMSLFDYWVIIVPFIIALFLFNTLVSYFFPMVGGITGLIILFIGAIINLYFQAKRLHDTGKSAWFLLLHIVIIIGSLAVLILVLLPGNKEENRYGKVPQRIFSSKK